MKLHRLLVWVLSAFGIAFVSLNYLKFWNARSIRKNEALHKVLGAEASNASVELSAADEGFLFGDSSYVWKLKFTQVPETFLGSLIISDVSDLKATEGTIEQLLHVKLPKGVRRTVMRRDINSGAVYVIREDGSDIIYIVINTL